MKNQNGFTMVEMIIAMAIGLVLMGGIYSNFMLQTKVQNFQSSLTDVTQDLTLVGQVMFQELKSAKAGSLIYTVGPPNSVLQYTDKDGNIGSFKYQALAGVGTKYLGKDSLCWQRPLYARCEEVMRGLSINGPDPDNLSVILPLGFDVYSYALPPDPTGKPTPSALSNMWVITLTGMYKTTQKTTGLVTHVFKVWQRN